MEETVSFIEAKEMAREALNRHSSANAISTYRQNKKIVRKETEKVNCQTCHTEIDKFSWSKRHKKLIERKFCLLCWQKNSPRHKSNDSSKSKDGTDNGAIAITGAIAIGVITSQPIDHMLFEPDEG